ncbi:hypothetical protein SLEP1_g42009 [Rubroshorea leprosula]|uniref:Reverse transcriptase domain-containing protein n=1 Tax=Rubroshorea leprosula TaxID=152421 RepID=A0AAV5L8D0_9ROSI|nr:hypothetical protein SLEP1_g42009 [Rubroshorea leprosula]
MACIVNGGIFESFQPSKGLRQGDPLSPYLFILCLEFLSLHIQQDVQNGHWKVAKLGRSGPIISHLFFADDLIFIGKASTANASHLKNLLSFFCSCFGQNINQSKSKILFSKNTDDLTKFNICHTLGFAETNSFGKYLGIPITPKKVSKKDCPFIMDKVKAKLAGWKANMFSLAGRATLTSSVLSTIPNYYMQAERITQPKRNGGIGIKSAKEANQASMAKLQWRLAADKGNLWARALKQKYKIEGPRHDFSNSPSLVCKDMAKGSQIFGLGISWIPRNGNNTYCWQDRWCGSKPLNFVLYGPFKPTDCQLKVADILTPQGTWDLDKISYHLPSDIVACIQAIPLSKHTTEDDKFVWNSSANGTFSMNSAYNITKGLHICQKDQWYWIWKVHTLPKIQYFLRLLMHGRIQTFDTLAKWGVVTDSTCPMCRLAPETINHLFRECPFSNYLWSAVSPRNCPLLHHVADFKDWLRANCVSGNSNCDDTNHWSTFFTFTLWTIWFTRNQFVHNSTQMNIQQIKNVILNRVQEFLKYNSPDITPRKKTVIHIGWSPPPLGFLKLNIDGSAQGNPGMAGAGGIFRDHNGSWIYGYSRRVGFTTSLVAELWAIRDSLDIAVNRGISKLILEIDSKVAELLLKSADHNFHSLGVLIDDCRRLMQENVNRESKDDMDDRGEEIKCENRQVVVKPAPTTDEKAVGGDLTPTIRWKDAALEGFEDYNHLPPWLTFLKPVDAICNFIDPFYGEKYFVNIPNKQSKTTKMYYSRDGWCVILQGERSMFLWNPL